MIDKQITILFLEKDNTDSWITFIPSVDIRSPFFPYYLEGIIKGLEFAECEFLRVQKTSTKEILLFPTI